MANTRSKRRRRKAGQIPIPQQAISLPKFKKEVIVPRRQTEKIRKNVAKSNLEEAFNQKLQAIVRLIKVTDDLNKSERKRTKKKQR